MKTVIKQVIDGRPYEWDGNKGLNELEKIAISKADFHGKEHKHYKRLHKWIRAYRGDGENKKEDRQRVAANSEDTSEKK